MEKGNTTNTAGLPVEIPPGIFRKYNNKLTVLFVLMQVKYSVNPVWDWS
jgi:hypothetical protein